MTKLMPDWLRQRLDALLAQDLACICWQERRRGPVAMTPCFERVRAETEAAEMAASGRYFRVWTERKWSPAYVDATFRNFLKEFGIDYEVVAAEVMAQRRRDAKALA